MKLDPCAGFQGGEVVGVYEEEDNDGRNGADEDAHDAGMGRAFIKQHGGAGDEGDHEEGDEGGKGEGGEEEGGHTSNPFNESATGIARTEGWVRSARRVGAVRALLLHGKGKNDINQKP